MECLLSFIQAYYYHQDFMIPGLCQNYHIPDDLLIIACSNPQSTSIQHTTLLPQYYDLCFCYCSIHLSFSELTSINTILQPFIPSTSQERFKQVFFSLIHYLLTSSISFSLHDIFTVKHICENSKDLPLLTVLWVLFAGKLKERNEMSKLLDHDEEQKIYIEKKETECWINGYSSIHTHTVWNPEFKEWCFTTSEIQTVYQLAVALNAKQPLILYGPSPSGKTYTISKVALIYNQPCHIIQMNQSFLLEQLLGTFTAEIDHSLPKVTFTPGLFINAMEKGEWIVLKNIDLAPKEVIESLLSLCSSTPSFEYIQNNIDIQH